MHSVSAVGGLSTVLNATPHNKQSGPPDHAKAWGWRAKQAAGSEETQATNAVASAEPATEVKSPDAATAPDAVDQTSQDATATLPPPSEADMESVIAGLITGPTDTGGTDATAEYNMVQALFS